MVALAAGVLLAGCSKPNPAWIGCIVNPDSCEDSATGSESDSDWDTSESESGTTAGTGTTTGVDSDPSAGSESDSDPSDSTGENWVPPEPCQPRDLITCAHLAQEMSEVFGVDPWSICDGIGFNTEQLVEKEQLAAALEPHVPDPYAEGIWANDIELLGYAMAGHSPEALEAWMKLEGDLVCEDLQFVAWLKAAILAVATIDMLEDVMVEGPLVNEILLTGKLLNVPAEGVDMMTLITTNTEGLPGLTEQDAVVVGSIDQNGPSVRCHEENVELGMWTPATCVGGVCTVNFQMACKPNADGVSFYEVGGTVIAGGKETILPIAIPEISGYYSPYRSPWFEGV